MDDIKRKFQRATYTLVNADGPVDFTLTPDGVPQIDGCDASGVVEDMFITRDTDEPLTLKYKDEVVRVWDYLFANPVEEVFQAVNAFTLKKCGV